MFLSYELIILTEIWLTLDITDAEFGLDSFKIFRLDSNPDNIPYSRDEGVLITINTSIIPSLVTLSHPDVEPIFTILFLSYTSLLLVPYTCIYALLVYCLSSNHTFSQSSISLQLSNPTWLSFLVITICQVFLSHPISSVSQPLESYPRHLLSL